MRRRVQTTLFNDSGDLVGAASVYILRAGADIVGGNTIPAAGSAAVTVRHPGSLKDTDDISWLASTGVITYAGQLSISGDPTYSAGTWSVTIANSGAEAIIEANGRLVANWQDTGTYVTWYADDTVSSGSTGVKLTSTKGELEFYVDVADIDIYVTKTGETARYFTDLSVEARDRVSALEFGATGDGTTNDAQAILRCLEYAAYHGLEAYFPPGTYEITATMTQAGSKSWQTAPLFIRGAGIGITKWTTAETDGPMIDFYSGSSVTVRDMSFVGNASGTGSAPSGIRVFGEADILVSRCEFLDFSADGITVARDTGLATVADSVLIQGCIFDNCRRGGVVITGGEDVRIEGCYFGDTATATGDTLSASLHLEEDNDAYEIQRVSIVGNTILGGMSILEYAQSAATANMEVVVTGNVINGLATSTAVATQGGGETAISIFNVNKLVFTDNVCHQRYTGTKTGSTPGFSFRSNSCRIADNYFENDKGDIVVQWNPNSPSAAGTPPTAGEHCIIENNTIIGDDTATSSSGLTLVPDGSAVWHKIDNNVIRDVNGSYGINVTTASGVTTARNMSIRGNIIEGTITWGIRVIENNASPSASLLFLSDNVVPGSSGGFDLNRLDQWTVREHNNGYTGAGAKWTLDSGAEDTTITYDERSHAEMHILPANKAASTAITATTYLKIGGTATAGEATSDFTITTTSGGQIKYTGATTKVFLVNVAFSMTSSKNTAIAYFQLDKTTALQTKSEVQRYISTGTDVGAAAVSAVLELATDDTVELWCTLSASTSDTITIECMNMSVVEV